MGTKTSISTNPTLEINSNEKKIREKKMQLLKLQNYKLPKIKLLKITETQN